MQIAKRFFAKPSWIVQVALILSPLALCWSATIDLPFLTRHTLAGHILGRDFANYWMGAHLFLAHRTDVLFDPTLYTHAVTTTWGKELGGLTFSYPPTVLPMIAWLGFLPYPVALALWTLLGLAALFAAAWPHSKCSWVAAAMLVSPAVLACLDDGQNGLFTSAIMLLALSRIDRRPILAGALIGVLTAKPHLGLLLPVALLAAGRWRVIGAAAVSALFLIALSIILAGPEAWRLYLTATAPYQGFLFQNSVGPWQTMTPSPAIATVAAGGSWPLAFAIQAAVSLGMVALVAAVFAARGQRPVTDLDKVVLLAATFLASPYSFNYDMAALAVCLLAASVTQPELEQSPWWRWGATLLWSAPMAMVLVGMRGLVLHHHWLPVGTFMLLAGLALVTYSLVGARHQHVGLGLKRLCWPAEAGRGTSGLRTTLTES